MYFSTILFYTRNLFRKPGQLLIWQKTILQSEFSFICRINLWHMEITDQSFNIVDIKPANMEELTEVITASEFHPKECNHFVYSSSKGTIRLCDMRSAALCDNHAKRKGFIFIIITLTLNLTISYGHRILCVIILVC